MSVHYEIHEGRDGSTFRLVKGPFPNTWAGVNNQDFKALEFDTRGGAKNYAHKHNLRKGYVIVRVLSAQASE